jgi:hypothetical protein
MTDLSFFNKRLNHELSVLNKEKSPRECYKKEYDLNFLIGFYKEDKTVVFFIDVDYKIIVINMVFESKFYPFKPPNIIIGRDHNHSYFNLLNENYSRVNLKEKVLNNFRYKLAIILEISDKYLETLLNLNNCWCCSSILCSNQWNPCKKICNILQEIYDKSKVVRKIKYYIFLKHIMLKYLNFVIPYLYIFM